MSSPETLPEAPVAWPAPHYRTPPGWTPPATAARARAKAKPLRPRELAAVAALVVLTDVVLFAGNHAHTGGLGLALFFVAVPAVAFAAARVRPSPQRLGARFAIASALLVLAALRSAWSPTIGSVLSGFGLLLAFVVSQRVGRVHVPEVALSALRALPALPSRIASVARGASLLVGRSRFGRSVVLPVAVPVALCLLFVGVFGLANPVVAHALDVALHALSHVLAFPSFARIVVWALAAIGGAALLRPAIVRARGREAADTTSVAGDLQLLVARNALVALNVLFAAYHALDAAYLWAGSPPPGTTTQAYAHQGAFWLTVALAMLTAVVGVLFRGPLAHDARALRVRHLAYAWAAQGLLLAVGTYRRIGIHVAKSGLSDLRIVGILGTTLVATGLVLVLVKLHRGRSWTWLVRRQLDAFALTAVVYALFPTHLVSAKVNVARIAAGEYRPVLHMFRQSKEVESAGELVALLEHDDKRVRQGVAALVESERAMLRNDVEAAGTWRERDVASRRTLAVLDASGARTEEILRGVDPQAARRVLLEISRAANEDRSLEELFAIPAADAADLGESGLGGRSTY